MISDEQVIQVVKPAASAILGVDVAAVARLAERKSAFAALDPQPAAMAMAGERRAMVATKLRANIAPELGWTLIEDNLACGAYEWLAGEVIVRLSKTTRASRFDAFKVCYGVQGSLFETTAHPNSPRDEVLIRLMGSVLTETSVDAAAVRPDGRPSTAIPLKAIAEAQVERMPATGTPPGKTTVRLPGQQRSAESSG